MSDATKRLAAGYTRPADPAWAPLREQIAAEVLDRGWRFQATVTAIEAELRSGSTVYRYNRDALPGGEGGCHLCASWLVEATSAAGDAPRHQSCSSRSWTRQGRPDCFPRNTTQSRSARWATLKCIRTPA